MSLVIMTKYFINRWWTRYYFYNKRYLEDNGFKIYVFNDPIIALKSYNINFYDLVILDIKMPKIRWVELYTKIREKDHKVKIW